MEDARGNDQLARFHALFTKSPNFAAVLAGRGHRFVATNPAYQRLIGNRDVLGQQFADALPELADQGLVEVLDRTFETGEAHVGRAKPVAITSDDGAEQEVRWLDFVYQPVRDDTGTVIAIFIEGTDVTDRHRAREDLQNSEARNRQILDAATDHAIIALSPDGTVTRWNAGAERILGWRESEMLGRSVDRIFTPEDRDAGRLASELRSALDSGHGNGEGWRVRRSGDLFWASGKTTPVHDADGEVVGFVKVLRDRTVEYEAAEVLRESREMLERAQSAGGVGVFSIDVDGDTLVTTPEFCRLFGVPVAAAYPVGEIERLVLPEDAERMSNARLRASGDLSLDTEYRIRRANDGAVRWIARRAEVQRPDDDLPGRLVGVVQDITAQREAGAALAESEARFRAFNEALPNQVWSAKADGRLDWVNRLTYEYAGVDEAELLRQGWERRVHPDDIAEAAARWSDALATGQTYETEFRLLSGAGIYRWHLARAVPMRGPDGAITRWIGTNTDIEDRRAASNALADLNATLEERVEQAARQRDLAWKNSRDMQAVIDEQGVFRAINDAWSDVLGWSGADVVGKSFLDFIHPDDHPSSEQALAIASRDELAPYENRYRHSDGSYRWISWVAAPESGLIYASGRHITADKEAAIALEAAQEQLRQAQKMEAVGQLTGGVAHDFNNLLTVIRGSVELLGRDDLPAERRRKYIAAIGETAERASRLTGQLLAFARRQSLTPEVFDVGESLHKVVDMVRTLAGSRIILSLDLPEAACVVHADRGQFDTTIVNLAINARDAMDGEGQLKIGVGSVSGIPAIRGHDPVRAISSP